MQVTFPWIIFSLGYRDCYLFDVCVSGATSVQGRHRESR